MELATRDEWSVADGLGRSSLCSFQESSQSSLQNDLKAAETVHFLRQGIEQVSVCVCVCVCACMYASSNLIKAET